MASAWMPPTNYSESQRMCPAGTELVAMSADPGPVGVWPCGAESPGERMCAMPPTTDLRGYMLAMSAMVEDEQAAAEVGEARVVLDRGRRGDDLGISRILTDGSVGARIGAVWFGERGGGGGDRCRGS